MSVDLVSFRKVAERRSERGSVSALSMIIIATAFLALSSCATSSGFSPEAQARAIEQLEANHNSVANGESDALDEDLLAYLYEQRRTFPVQSEDLESEAAFDDIIGPYNHLNRLLVVLLTADNEILDEETAKIFSILGYMNLRLIGLSEEVMNDLDPASPDYPRRVEGMNQAYIGLSNMLIGGVGVAYVEDPDGEVAAIVIDGLDDYGPPTIALLPGEIQEQVFLYLSSAIEPSVEAIRMDDYRRMISDFEAAASDR
jgi:hypothetical protein